MVSRPEDAHAHRFSGDPDDSTKRRAIPYRPNPDAIGNDFQAVCMAQSPTLVVSPIVGNSPTRSVSTDSTGIG
jgi:hypothetical protein